MNKIAAYILVWICGLIAVIGIIALIFESPAQTKIAGLLAAVVSIIIGNIIARKYWPNKSPQIKENEKSI